jgi:ketosteroid isomerase-like protein
MTDVNDIVCELQARVQQLEDVQAIATLKAAYCDAMDGGWDRPAHDADRGIELFVDECSWSAPGIGEAKGRAAVYALFKDFRKFPFAFHRVTNQVITVNGDTATGTWRVLVPIKFSADNSSWIGGIYTDVFARTPTGWKIVSVDFEQALLSTQEPQWQVGTA